MCAPCLPKFQRSVNVNESASARTALILFLEPVIPISECHGKREVELLHLILKRKQLLLIFVILVTETNSDTYEHVPELMQTAASE